jgi:uncharacterized protein
MNHSFVDAVHQGKNDWWRYVLGIIVIFFGGYGVGLIAAGLAIACFLISAGNDLALLASPIASQKAIDQLLKTPSIANYVINNIPFVFFLLGIFLATRVIHQRSIKSLISAANTFQFRRFATGFGVWFGLLTIVLGISYLQAPEDFVLTFSPVKWGILVVVALILTPIQIASEELLCRAYLMQGLSLLTRNHWILLTVPSFLFAAAHFGNPEMARDSGWMAFSYWGFGVFLAALTLRDNRLELALGIHAAQNLFLLLFANTQDSVIKTPAVLTLQDAGDPKWGFVAFLVQAALFSGIVFGRKSRRVAE